MKREDYISALTPQRLRNVAKKLEIPLMEGATKRREAAARRPFSPAEIRDELTRAACGEQRILAYLNTDELSAICKQFRIRIGKLKRGDLVEAILERLQRDGCVRAYEDYPEAVDEHPGLRAWADEYCRQVEADGDTLLFGVPESDEPVASTLRAVCAVYEMNEWDDWLSWQCWSGPKGGGPWYVLSDLEGPWEWFRATIYMKDPRQFAFSHFYMASDMEDITFVVRRRGRARFGKEEQVDFARAVVDGMRHDYDDRDFLVVCTRQAKSLVVRILNPLALSADDPDYKPDRDGVCWRE